MPQIGFVCPNGNEKTFEQCLTCKARCQHPLPFLMSFMKERPIVKNTYSVTECLMTPLARYLKRNFNYFTVPQKKVWATFGSACHMLMAQNKDKIKELGLENEYLIEEANHFEVPIETDEGTVTLVGTPDLRVTSEKTIYDYKAVKSYFVRKLKEAQDWQGTTYHLQLNAYRLYKYPDDKMRLVCLIKDHSRAIAEKYGLNEIEYIDVPRVDDIGLHEFFKAILTESIRGQRDPSCIRPCSDEELWFGKEGIPLRCQDYCDVSHLCPQWNKWRTENERRISR